MLICLGKTLHLDHCNNVSISADCNGGDIARFVVSEVDRLISKKLLLDGRIKNRLRDKLIDTLTSGAQGMFRWVAMSLETLQHIKFRQDFEKALGQLPSKLSGLYDIIYSQIDMTESHGRDIAIKTLKWLLCAQRLMRAQELIAAVTFPSEGTGDSIYDSDEDSTEENSNKNSNEADLGSWSRSDEIQKNDIIRSCRNLVTVDAEHGHFRFAHQSVREYLLAREEYTTEEQHALAVERCLDVYLTEVSTNLVNAKLFRRNSHLKSYSRMYWPLHYKYVENYGSQALERKISTFMTQGSTTSPAYLHWASDINSHIDSIVLGNFQDNLRRRLRIASAEPKTYLSALCVFGFSSLMKNRRLSLEDRNQSINTHGSLLTIASKEGHDQIVEILLAQGVDVNAQIDSWSALHYASREGYESVVKMLLDKGAHVSLQTRQENTALLLASKNGHDSVVKLLLENGADIDARNNTGERALYHAIRRGNESIVKILLDHKADVNAQLRSKSAIQSASQYGHESMVKLLLDHGADSNAQDRLRESAMHKVTKSNNSTIARLLLNHKADPNIQNKFGESPLHLASQNGGSLIVEILLNHGADVHARTRRDDSVLHYAADRGHCLIVETLLNHGVDINLQNKDGESALHYASHKGSDMAVKMLLDHEANVDVRNKNGESVLHCASGRGHVSTVRILLDHGADIHARTKNGDSALHFASTGTADVVELLLSHGADLYARNKLGKSVVDWARDGGSYYLRQRVHDIIQSSLNLELIDIPHIRRSPKVERHYVKG